MMKILLLLACAVCVSGSTLGDRKMKIALLDELITELDKVQQNPLMETKGEEIYLVKPKSDGCKHEYFCQAESELVMKVSGLCDSFANHFRTDKLILRRLDQYNKLYGVKTCKPVDEDEVEITLRDFLKTLSSCVKHVNGQKK